MHKMAINRYAGPITKIENGRLRFEKRGELIQAPTALELSAPLKVGFRAFVVAVFHDGISHAELVSPCGRSATPGVSRGRADNGREHKRGCASPKASGLSLASK